MATYTIPALSVVPTLDGNVNAAEWSDALALNLYQVVGPVTVYLKVDACYLWVAATLSGGNYAHGPHDHLEFYYDQNRSGSWNGPMIDGTFSIPGNHQPPYGTMNGQTVAFSYLGSPSWQTSSSSGGMIYHRAWYSPQPMQLPTSQAEVRLQRLSSSLTHIEAKIDYKNSPLRLAPGIYVGMNIKGYIGPTGICQILGNEPYTPGYYFTHYPTMTYMHSYTVASVSSSGDIFDVLDVTVDNSTNFIWNNGSGSTIPVSVTGTPNPAPYTTNWKATFKGPYPATTPTIFSGTETFTAPNQTKTINIPTTGLTRGFYEIDVEVEDPTVCGPAWVKKTYVVLITNPGENPCVVWPGDKNNNGTCNLADKTALAKYIYDANLNPLWLYGPARILTGLKPPTSTPLDIFKWQAQAALPWATALGCYMDADGNGFVSNLDLAAIKFNAGKTHTLLPKDGPSANLPGEYTLYQNYPNPFNPATQIGYELPEASRVTLKVVDVLGREVAELVNGVEEAGFKNVMFGSQDLASGVYYYRLTAVGLESGKSFTQTMKMTAAK